MKHTSNLNLFLIIIISITFSSCKLFESKDTTAPIVNFTIEGGNEISRGVTLYLDIEDDSKIDYVDIIIDDTTAVTVTSNFDTIRFDITPFADESKHQLYAKVADEEGNIGESEKLDVVITEYPGWRIYNDLYGWDKWTTKITIDDNGYVWITVQGTGIYIFNPINNSGEFLSSSNSELPNNNINDIAVLNESRVWIGCNTSIAQYDYSYKKFHKIIVDQSIDRPILVIDNNYNLWIGSNHAGLYFYDGIALEQRVQLNQYFWDITKRQDNSIFLSTSGAGVYSFNNGDINFYDPWNEGVSGKLTHIACDSSGNIWVTEEGQRCAKFDGANWYSVEPSDIMCQPLYVNRNGLIYTQSQNRGLVLYNGTNWFYFDTVDSPFKEKYSTENNIDDLEIFSSIELARRGIAEAPNGDIWMVAGGNLMRYRPSLGGYP